MKKLLTIAGLLVFMAVLATPGPGADFTGRAVSVPIRYSGMESNVPDAGVLSFGTDQDVTFTFNTTTGVLAITGGVTVETVTFTSLTVTGAFNAQSVTNIDVLTASKPVFTDASKNLTSTGTLAVDQGGTGVSDPTDHAVYVGSGSSPMDALVVGGANEVLCGAAAADPTFRALVNADVPQDLTVVGGTIDNSVIGGSTPLAGSFTAIVGTGVDINPSITPNTSLRPVDITYDYAGAVDNAGGVDMDLFGYRVTITQTSSNDDPDIGDRGYLQPIRSDIHINGFVDDAYALYGKVYVDGTSTLNQAYGANLVVGLGSDAITMDESGNIAGVGISVDGSGDVTCGGTGYGKVSGMYINWNQTTDLTVDSCGVYIGVASGATLDSGYRVNASGSLTSSFHSYNSSGTPTQALKVEGAHTNAFAFPAEGTAPVSTYTTEEAPTGKIAIKVGGDTRYLAYWD